MNSNNNLESLLFNIFYVLFPVILIIYYWIVILKKNRRDDKILEGLFLDDERNWIDVTWCRYRGKIKWTTVRTPDDFIHQTNRKTFDVYSFDHDLGKQTNQTGYDLLKKLCNGWLDNPLLKEPQLYFHTQNPVGKRNMECYWKSFLRHITEVG